ncbi:hypothetical protein [Pseudorhodoferax soli]|uniref:Uncharacterized protein n=1 Tax=Pseudorhodoferax soli TaxID=545864 RepID=A0A368Y138_9BURK|nr:hypothetical protein [Pseudorhodoferax soli]RCW73973.1 hypothetical protein DES41_102290 [Pseudorhodoferax soli]
MLSADTRAGPLQVQAEALSPRAARIAASLLADEPLVPTDLRAALHTALVAGDADSDGPPIWHRGDPDGEAACRFVDACRAACAP